MASDKVFAMRARLEAKHEELIKALRALGVANVADAATPASAANVLLLLLGIVAFWQSMGDPTESQTTAVSSALDVIDIHLDMVRQNAMGS